MPATPDPLKILHVLRAPVGGLFRHVVDLARGQASLGHHIGIIADSTTGGATADAVLAALSHDLALGLTRLPMSRHIDLSDIDAIADVAQRVSDARADVVHGHGAKGGGTHASPGRTTRSASTRRTAAACTIAGSRRSACSISRSNAC
jgi:hypothetical protein